MYLLPLVWTLIQNFKRLRCYVSNQIIPDRLEAKLCQAGPLAISTCEPTRCLLRSSPSVNRGMARHGTRVDTYNARSSLGSAGLFSLLWSPIMYDIGVVLSNLVEGWVAGPLFGKYDPSRRMVLRLSIWIICRH